MLNRIFNRLISGMAVLASLLLLFITFSISYSILTRIIGISSPIWTVQFNEYALLWMTFLGTAWILQRRKHVSMDIITGRLKPRTMRFMDLLHSIMGMCLCGVLFWYTSRMVWNQFQRGVIDVKAVDIPKYVILTVIPFGFLLLGIQFLQNLFKGLKRNYKP